MAYTDPKLSSDLDPYDLVSQIAEDNRNADMVHIKRLVRRALAGPEIEYVDAFVDETTDRCMKRYLAREAEKAMARPKPVIVSNSSEKFVCQSAPPSHPVTVTTPRLDPARRAEPAQAYARVEPASRPAPEPDQSIRSISIPHRPVRVEPPAPMRSKERMQEAPDAADLGVKRARAFLVGSLLNHPMLNGKKLGDCTLRECEQFGTFFGKAIRAAAPKHAPLDAPVSLYFNDEKLRKIQTWTNDVLAP